MSNLEVQAEYGSIVLYMRNPDPAGRTERATVCHLTPAEARSLIEGIGQETLRAEYNIRQKVTAEIQDLKEKIAALETRLRELEGGEHA
ncbi:hypothetical protein V5G24_23185 [Xanthobacter sp. VTT E-85241]|uniref:hypothetical protein n=1 Tax=Roseixanthobacter finlandensis TaxID=3119922 RepID=UPI003729711E